MQTAQPQRDRAEINRENAQHSTGPKTETGKQRIRLNALRHGLTGQTVVLPTEELEAYQKFTSQYFDDLKPQGVIEQQLVRSLAEDAWRLNRARTLENNLITKTMLEQSKTIDSSSEPMLEAFSAVRALEVQTKALNTLSMHQNRIARQYERTVNQLREIQAERRETEERAMREAADYLKHHRLVQEKNAKAHPGAPAQPYNPAADGFEFSVAQIDAWMHKNKRRAEAFGAEFFARAAA